MDWMFEDFRSELSNFYPLTRKRAIEITEKLVNKEALDKNEAIKEGIKTVEEWFLILKVKV